ncbi:hypothetical protein HK100_004731 [Physocladia obscura]|uniref:Uncharacterized protein n=1 Tax=Physocladia obscura TaxID=109957 RepID=A0AAD5T763_9FUNG|nr:hypothetical protein HK100_004731 [Physocladia obscura]
MPKSRKNLSVEDRFLYQQEHVLLRAQERYGVTITPLDYAELNTAIRAQDSRVTYRVKDKQGFPVYEVLHLDTVWLMTELLRSAVKDKHATKLEPRAFFVAWRGVLTLAFAGFPASLAALKVDLDALGFLAPENSGSKWPKMSLACLKDDAKPLTADQLANLSQLCSQMSTNLALLANDFQVSSISYTHFACRSLEKLVFRADIALSKTSNTDNETDELASADNYKISEDQIHAVDNVLSEYETDKDGYLLQVQKAGNRESLVYFLLNIIRLSSIIPRHYRSMHVESTLVVFFGNNPEVTMILEEFKRAVDFLLPDYYAWFHKDALHCTIRAL